MRKHFLILTLVLALVLAACSGDVCNVSREMDESEIDSPALNPDSTYNNYRRILTRSGGAWTLQNWGYG